MLRIVLALTLLVACAAVAEPAAAEIKRKAHKAPAPGPAVVAAPRPADYRELLADKLPVGSIQWWEQMRREGRLGGETP